MSFACTLSAYHVRVALAEVNGGYQGPWDRSYTQLTYLSHCWETEPGSLGRPGSAPSPQALSPAPNLFKNKTKPKSTLWTHHKHAT